MILVQMYNIFRLLIGVPYYSIIVVSPMEVNKRVENDGHLNKQLPGINYIQYAVLFISHQLISTNPAVVTR